MNFFVFIGKTGLLIGNEANGLTEETAACADRLIKILMEHVKAHSV